MIFGPRSDFLGTWCFWAEVFFHGIDGKWFGILDNSRCTLLVWMKPSWCSKCFLTQSNSLIIFLKMRHRKETPQVVSIPFQVPANASKIHRILGKPMKYALVDFRGVPIFRQWGSCVSSAVWRWCPLRTGWSRNGYETCETEKLVETSMLGLGYGSLSLTWLCARMFPAQGQWRDHGCHRAGTPDQGHPKWISSCCGTLRPCQWMVSWLKRQQFHGWNLKEVEVEDGA